MLTPGRTQSAATGSHQLDPKGPNPPSECACVLDLHRDFNVVLARSTRSGLRHSVAAFGRVLDRYFRDARGPWTAWYRAPK